MNRHFTFSDSRPRPSGRAKLGSAFSSYRLALAILFIACIASQPNISAQTSPQSAAPWKQIPVPPLAELLQRLSRAREREWHVSSPCWFS